MSPRPRLSLALVAGSLIAIAIAWLGLRDEPPNAFDAAPSASAAEPIAIEIDPAPTLAELEARVRDATANELVPAWLQLRLFGFRAQDVAQRVNTTWSSVVEDPADQLSNMPEWVGSEPAVALASTLLEAQVGYDPRMKQLANLDTPDPTEPIALAWRIEFSTLLRMQGDAPTSTRGLASLVDRGLKTLERGPAPASFEYARLAQALFRGGAVLGNTPWEPRLRRVVGRLIATSESNDPSPTELERLGARLEALAAFAHPRKDSKEGVDEILKNTLRRERQVVLRAIRAAAPGALSSERELAAAVAVARALRLTRSVLGEPKPGLPKRPANREKP